MSRLRESSSKLLDRAFRSFGKVEAGEGALIGLLLVCVFLILTSYYLLKTAREGLILSGGTFGLRGDELKTYATGAMAVLLFGLVPAYGWLAGRVRRIALVNASYAAVMVSLLGFFALARAGVPIGLPFFIWLGLVSLFLVAQFWSYCNDIYSEEQGKRLFGVIAIGGSMGAVLGPRIAKATETFLLLPLAAVILLGALALLNGIDRHLATRQRTLAAAPIDGPGGFTLVLRDRYLLLIGLMLLVLNLINTTGEYVLSNAVREHAIALVPDSAHAELAADAQVAAIQADRRELIKGFYADFFSWVNLIGFLVQALLVSRILSKVGVRVALFIMPIVVFGAYSAIAVVGGLAVIRAAKIADNASDYSLQNTVRQALFLPTSRAVKYKAKAAIDTMFVRAGDLLSALLVGFWIHQVGLRGRELAVVNLGLVVLWLGLCAGIVRRHLALSPAPARGRGSAAATATAAAAGAIVLAIAAPAPATAQPAPPDTAASVAGAPLPGEESGRADDGEPESATRKVGRAVLVVPRGLFDLVFTPPRKVIWAYEHYHVADRVRRLLFNDAETMGVYPTVKLESGFGVTGGAAFVVGLGRHEQLRLKARSGGRYRDAVSADVRSYVADGRMRLDLRGELERRPEERFHGVGNADGGTETRYRQRLARVALTSDVGFERNLHARLAAALTDVALATADMGPAIDEVYDMATLVGFDGVRHVYGEAELAWDNRRQDRSADAQRLYATGWLASAFAGHVAVAGARDFWRYGADVQHFLRLGRGQRVLAARLHGEAVSGRREEVPFVELPALGGSTVLRGYSAERFRDRVLAFGSLEYEWDLAHTFFASVFVDAGRVYPSAAELSLDGLRCGYGLAFELHDTNDFFLRGSVASSIDGGVFVNVSFDPVFDIERRTVRR
jgi:AAA family ATP:ADP antiporter